MQSETFYDRPPVLRTGISSEPPKPGEHPFAELPRFERRERSSAQIGEGEGPTLWDTKPLPTVMIIRSVVALLGTSTVYCHIYEYW